MEAVFYAPLMYQKIMVSAKNEYIGHKKCIFSGGFKISQKDGRGQFQRWGKNLLFWQDFYWKVHENERKKLKRGRPHPLDPLMNSYQFFLAQKRVDRAIGILTWHGTSGWYVMWRSDDKSHIYELESSSGLLRVFLISTLKQKEKLLVIRCFVN